MTFVLRLMESAPSKNLMQKIWVMSLYSAIPLMNTN